jgi:hypothetical protein
MTKSAKGPILKENKLAKVLKYSLSNYWRSNEEQL